MTSIGSPALWLGFATFVLAMLALDLGVFHKKAHEVSLREAGIWSAVWVTLALCFNVGLLHWFGSARAVEFLTGYLLEKALSVDNIFVFVVLFAAFRVPAAHQHRVLFWGVLGALVLRGLFIAAGAALIQRFHFVMYIFGALLLVTGAKLMFAKETAEEDPMQGWIYRAFRRVVPATREFHGSKFWVKRDGRWLATPLLAALILAEVSDVIFAVDSIPAVFAVTTDPFIVFTSNIFAILGLRSLYFLLAGIVHKFHYLKPALAVVLGFIGVKLLLSKHAPIPTSLSLGVIAALVGGAVALSLFRPRRVEPAVVPIDESER